MILCQAKLPIRVKVDLRHSKYIKSQKKILPHTTLKVVIIEPLLENSSGN